MFASNVSYTLYRVSKSILYSLSCQKANPLSALFEVDTVLAYRIVQLWGRDWREVVAQARAQAADVTESARAHGNYSSKQV